MNTDTERDVSAYIHSIPRDLHRRFRVALLERGQSMQQVLLAIIVQGMEEYIREHEKGRNGR